MRIIPKHIGYGILVGILVTLWVVTGAIAQEGDEKQSVAKKQNAKKDDRADWALQKPEQALARAREIIGLADHAVPQFTAELVTLADDNTPFLKHQIVGRPIWHIVITNWKLRLESAPSNAKDSCTRTFDVFVDPKNGHLLKIVSCWPEGVPPIAPQPRVDFAEEEMVRAGRELYHGFPDTEPAINFLQALEVVYTDGFGNPLVAKQIVAHYVVRSAMARMPRPVWAITLRGIPPFRAAYPGVPVDARNHIRNIIDAQTGKWVCAGTSPQPEPEE